MAFSQQRQFETEVFPAELGEIRERRRVLGLPAPGGSSAAASVDHELVGLALSGGGIRSAAAGLGVLQAIAARDILPRVDYLSTVSGGSLIGCSLSGVLNSPETSPENSRFPLGFEAGAPERPAVRYLRNHRRYLAPSGMLDMLRLPATLLRGMIDILALLIPVLVVAVTLTELLAALFDFWGRSRLRLVPLALLIAFVTLAWLQPVLFRLFPGRFTWARRNRYGNLLATALLTGVAAALALPLVRLIQNTIDLGWSNVNTLLHRYVLVVWMAIGVVIALSLIGMMARSLRTVTRAAVMMLVGALGYGVVFALYLLLCVYHIDNASLWDGRGEWLFIGAGVLGAVYAWLLTNPNVIGQFIFFRDRLSRAFVFRLDSRHHVQPADDLKLSSLNMRGSAAPYHLVNATINMQGDPAADLAGRYADFFLFSRHYVGGPATGYVKTEMMERADPQLTLATALGVSGAGLAPNMGVETVRPLVFLFTLLDLRLDYWLPHPAAVRRHAGAFRWLQPLGPIALAKEAFSRLDARGSYVNLSDGGQIENLGIYELLKRRCRWIIDVDADADPEMTCICLGRVLRYARLDLSSTIDIQLDPVRPGASGLSAAHWVVGDIDYGNGERGRLIFLKLSMTGDEPEAIREYRTRFPAFPQQSSSNQFFSEEQFEAYRALGEHIAAGFCASDEAAALSHGRTYVARHDLGVTSEVSP
jgi:hypothetical protein